VNRLFKGSFFPLIVIVLLVWLASQTLIPKSKNVAPLDASQAIAKVKKDKAFSVGVYKKYLKIEDENALGRAWEYATTNLFPALPYPKLDQFNDIVPVLTKRNPKAATYDVASMIDDSFVKSAADRGVDKK